MTDIDPEARLILARYEDIADQFTARVNDIGEEFAREWKTTMAAHDEAAREAERVRAEIDARHEAERREYEQAKEQEKPKTWARPERPTMLSFGGEFPDDERQAEPPARPEPPRPVPVPEPPAPVPATPPRDRFLDFSPQDEEEVAPARPRATQPPPARPTRRAPDDDAEDEDWSGRSWVR